MNFLSRLYTSARNAKSSRRDVFSNTQKLVKASVRGVRRWGFGVGLSISASSACTAWMLARSVSVVTRQERDHLRIREDWTYGEWISFLTGLLRFCYYVVTRRQHELGL